MIKFRSKFQFQILSQFYRTAEKVTKMKLVIIMVKSFDKYHRLFFYLLYLESGLLSVAYLTVANLVGLGIIVRSKSGPGI